MRSVQPRSAEVTGEPECVSPDPLASAFLRWSLGPEQQAADALRCVNADPATSLTHPTPLSAAYAQGEGTVPDGDDQGNSRQVCPGLSLNEGCYVREPALGRRGSRDRALSAAL